MHCKRPFSLYISLIILVTVFAFLSLCIGRYPIPTRDVFTIVFARMIGNEHSFLGFIETVVFNIRIPRILATIVVGSALAVNGATYQGIFRNPLVSPDILGTSAGAGFGATLALVLSFGFIGIRVYAFGFSLLAVSFTCFINIRFKKSDAKKSATLNL